MMASRGKNRQSLALHILLCILIISQAAAALRGQSNTPGLCVYDSKVSVHVQHMLCSVESGVWALPEAASAAPYTESGCLLDPQGHRCGTVRPIPKEEDTPASPPAPQSKNPDYHRFATQAERIVPKTWWRAAFSNENLLLSKNDKELPAKQFNERKSVENKKLKNIHQCVTRQNFIRKSFSFSQAMEDEESGETPLANPIDTGANKNVCLAAQEPSVQSFFKLFTKDPLMGGEFKPHPSNGGGGGRAPAASTEAGGAPPSPMQLQKNGWYPNKAHNGDIYMSAHETLTYFYTNAGGIWTGCFKVMRSSYCRGAIASAALVVSSHILHDISQGGKDSTGGRRLNKLGQTLVTGYMLASLGRGVLHGNSDNVGDESSTAWGVRTVDFIALQQAYLKLYIDSYGKAYTDQLAEHVPMAFPPGVDIYTKKAWSHLPTSVVGKHYLEPVYSSLRNWMYTEAGNLIDFGPYRPLVAVPEVTAALKSDNRRRILIDVGANGFFASPKYLLDSYAPYLPFTDAVMIEPEPHFSATIPEAYSKKYKITQHKIYAEVNTGAENDIIQLLQRITKPEDFVVLKFDVDPNKHAFGATMEWGFMFDLATHPVVAELVDELYIELHFHYPALYWQHYHSNWEALDAIRYLRSKGAVVHSWP